MPVLLYICSIPRFDEAVNYTSTMPKYALFHKIVSMKNIWERKQAHCLTALRKQGSLCRNNNFECRLWETLAMKISTLFKNLGIFALVLTVAVGCASTPEPEPTNDSERLAAEAIASAQAAIEEAAALGAEWRDAQSVLDEAKAAYESGDYDTAITLANQAESMARQAIADLNAQAKPEPMSASTYEVVAGDNLWNIAGSSSGYNDPYQWPLIYKANKGKINDADLIYPGQVFDIDGSPSSSDVAAAINHAKTRGAWSVGAVEASDEAYLAQ